MIKIEEVEALVLALRANNVLTCELTQPDGERLRLRLGTADSQAATAEFPPSPRGRSLRADDIGIYRSHHPFRDQDTGAPGPGTVVAVGDSLGFLQVGDRLRALSSEFSGTVAESLVQDGDLVAYAQELFRLAPDMP
ncbi:hypothetical protein [Bordetella genomosp. 12]|uniref:Lipoyl-binding domain-containing protein n=1 Tax=Bordetella genomosp. 12 TaxID=463035 RepID=A0A261V9N0_9BORD|nr:hypothetical protein [Bordetella genomosp. 12]OZI70868.1 hypothetical protein CAL22_13275 [Bordetella genomosp. 12]